MKPLHIFRAGRHTASCGTALDFDETTLQASAAAYDPALHEAPIVVGHPRDNGPAFGWIKGLSFSCISRRANGAVVRSRSLPALKTRR